MLRGGSRMETGVKWDGKLEMFVVYDKKTGKILKKEETCERARKYQHDLLTGQVKIYGK
jgi:hypothetical protein